MVTGAAAGRFLWAVLWAIPRGAHPRRGQQWNRPRFTGQLPAL